MHLPRILITPVKYYSPKFEYSRHQTRLRTYLLSEDGFGLTSKSSLFSVITSSTLGGFAFLGLLVLCHFMDLVNFALLAEGASCFGDVHLKRREWSQFRIWRSVPLIIDTCYWSDRGRVALLIDDGSDGW